MIEELKIVLDMVGDLSGIAAWVVGGFLLYKFVIYMSTSGAIVYLTRLGIERLFQYMVKPKVVVLEYNSYFFTDSVEREFRELLDRIKTGEVGISGGHYIHKSDINWLKEAIEEKRQRQDKRETSGDQCRA